MIGGGDDNGEDPATNNQIWPPSRASLWNPAQVCQSLERYKGFLLFSVILKYMLLIDRDEWHNIVLLFLQEIKKKYRNWCKWPGLSSMTGTKS